MEEKSHTVEEILATVKAGKPLRTWRKAKIIKIDYPRTIRGKCFYTLKLPNGKTTQYKGTAHNLKKLKEK